MQQRPKAARKSHSFQPLLFAPPQGADALPATVRPRAIKAKPLPRQAKEAESHVRLRAAPPADADHESAEDMLDELATQALLGPFRGEPPVDRRAVVAVLLALSDAAERVPGLVSVDLNPLMVVDGEPVAVDALVELASLADLPGGA